MRRSGPYGLIFDYDSPKCQAAPQDGREWAVVSGAGPFPDNAGPIFVSFDHLAPDEPARFGLRVEKHHCNAVDVIHGGMIATFADAALAHGLISLGDTAFNCPTISLSMDFLSGAVVGEWLETRVRVDHRTKNMAFLSVLISAGDRAVLRATSLFKAPPRAA